MTLTRARESRAAIERLYIEMRHLFNTGTYRRLGYRGEVLSEALLTLNPEIYGSVGDPNRVELAGLVYVIDRQPKGIEECLYVKLISEEGYKASGFEVLVPAARRRNCYRIDEDHMFIEVTRGRSEIYDILTHLTFLYMEAAKIKRNAMMDEDTPSMEWQFLERMVEQDEELDEQQLEIAFTHLSTILGRSYEETKSAFQRLASRPDKNNGLFRVVYHLGKNSFKEELPGPCREISFSPTLRERIGHHIYGERWASRIKDLLFEKDLLERPLHIISANLHSVMNALYAYPVLKGNGKTTQGQTIEQLAMRLSQPDASTHRKKVRSYAVTHGMYEVEDPSGTNITVQVFDTAQLDPEVLAPELSVDVARCREEKAVIVVMDYAFGEQAFETMDELLKSYTRDGKTYYMQVRSISVMGKAGILEGGKGDIMIPSAHVFEGTADNYPLDNALNVEDFEEADVKVIEGAMITVLGTSLQNRDVLSYFKESSWGAIGLEMEGAHYQKAIQAAAQIRRTIDADVVLRYAYYASDNPLLTGSTLASGSLGLIGVAPTYLITKQILKQILA